MEDQPWLQKLVDNIVALPDEAQCHRKVVGGHFCGSHEREECLGFDTTYPEGIKRWVEEQGKKLTDAACQCRPPFRVKPEQRLPYKDE